MNTLKSLQRGIISALSYFVSLIFEPLVYLLWVALLFALFLLIGNALSYWRDSLSRLTGWSRDNITCGGFFLIVGPLWVLGIRSALKDDYEQRRKTHLGPELPRHKRRRRGAWISLACVVAAVVVAIVTCQFY